MEEKGGGLIWNLASIPHVWRRSRLRGRNHEMARFFRKQVLGKSRHWGKIHDRIGPMFSRRADPSPFLTHSLAVYTMANRAERPAPSKGSEDRFLLLSYVDCGEPSKGREDPWLRSGTLYARWVMSGGETRFLPLFVVCGVNNR